MSAPRESDEEERTGDGVVFRRRTPVLDHDPAERVAERRHAAIAVELGTRKVSGRRVRVELKFV